MTRWLTVLVVLAACAAGCPLAHESYDTGRACVTDQQCPASEVCAKPDAAITDVGPAAARSLCYEKTALRRCTFDGGPSYYCFNSEYQCYHVPKTCLRYDWDGGCPTGCRDDAGHEWDAGCVEWQPERYGCAPAGRTP